MKIEYLSLLMCIYIFKIVTNVRGNNLYFFYFISVSFTEWPLEICIIIIRGFFYDKRYTYMLQKVIINIFHDMRKRYSILSLKKDKCILIKANISYVDYRQCDYLIILVHLSNEKYFFLLKKLILLIISY